MQKQVPQLIKKMTREKQSPLFTECVCCNLYKIQGTPQTTVSIPTLRNYMLIFVPQL